MIFADFLYSKLNDPIFPRRSLTGAPAVGEKNTQYNKIKYLTIIYTLFYGHENQLPADFWVKKTGTPKFHFFHFACTPKPAHAKLAPEAI